MQVLLINMPVSDLERPNLALSLLQSLLAREGVESEVRYANLAFAEKVGLAHYQRLGGGTRSWFAMFYGEALFQPAAFPDRPLDEEALLRFACQGAEPPARLRSEFRDWTRRALELVDEVAREVVERRPRIVGCTSTFQQHLPALALLRRVRELEPGIVTMMGGANCEARMGVATHRNFPWVDVVVSGEADGLVGPLVKGILQEGAEVWPLPPGVLGPRHRRTGDYPADPRATFGDLDSLPYPDFRDYFGQLGNSRLAPAVEVGLPLETSRGCWWGARHHCTFCGLNGGGMAFRRKTPARALAEMESLAEAWGTSNLEMVDNILDQGYLDTLVPALSASGRGWNIFYEVKSNLKPERLAALAAAGVTHLQPGIESLDSRLLALMDKGARGWQQVQFLKAAREHGICLSWNMLLGFPGEQDAWHQEMAELLPLLHHFQPPTGVTDIRYDRFSPYFERRQELGLDLRPHPMMEHLFPLEEKELFDLCYHFERIEEPGPKGPGRQALEEAAVAWRGAFSAANLVANPGPEGLELCDTRACARQSRWLLTGQHREVYEACQQANPDQGLPQESLEFLRQAGLLVTLDGRHLALGLSPQAPAVPYFKRFPGGTVLPERLEPQDLLPRGAFERFFFFQGQA